MAPRRSSQKNADLSDPLFGPCLLSSLQALDEVESRPRQAQGQRAKPHAQGGLRRDLTRNGLGAILWPMEAELDEAVRAVAQKTGIAPLRRRTRRSRSSCASASSRWTAAPPGISRGSMTRRSSASSPISSPSRRLTSTAIRSNSTPSKTACSRAARPRARAQSRRLRIWSAGCCTGEEPYTLAIQAAERGVAEDVEILATDINESYLEKAIAGVFSRRSVEKLPALLLEKYFAKKDRSFLLDERLRRKVDFKQLNLAETCYPSFLNGTADLDVIFCRNVLIYFDEATIARILLRFRDCLRPGGILALGPSEMVHASVSLSSEKIGEAFFHFNHQKKPAVPQSLDVSSSSTRRHPSARGPLAPPRPSPSPRRRRRSPRSCSTGPEVPRTQAAPRRRRPFAARSWNSSPWSRRRTTSWGSSRWRRRAKPASISEKPPTSIPVICWPASIWRAATRR